MITKELQDLVWSILPKEFKEEVKKIYSALLANIKMYQGDNPEQVGTTDRILWERTLGIKSTLCRIFGHNNLTSDAEGEGMLTVSAITVREMYAANERIKTDTPDKELVRTSDHINHVLRCLFGSKCLPDGEQPLKITAAEDCIAMAKEEMGIKDESKPAEPKFKVGDIVVVRGFKHPLLELDGAIVTILSYHDKGDFYSCAIAPNVGIDVDAKYLEPYTEPEGHIAEKRNLSQETVNCDNHFNTILNDSFSKERRLNIATLAMQGILSNPKLIEMGIYLGSDADRIARFALAHADALMVEADKLKEK